MIKSQIIAYKPYSRIYQVSIFEASFLGRYLLNDLAVFHPKREPIFSRMARMFAPTPHTIEYRRADEVGTPFCITVDFEAAEDNAGVTIRDRDATEQIRVPMEEVVPFLSKAIAGYKYVNPQITLPRESTLAYRTGQHISHVSAHIFSSPSICATVEAVGLCWGRGLKHARHSFPNMYIAILGRGPATGSRRSGLWTTTQS